MYITDPKELKGNIKKITSVRFRNVIDVPKELFACSNLTSLSLIKCQLETIPATVRNLQALKQLTISDCGLKALPVGLGSLKSLKELSISGNCLTSLPSDLAYGEQELSLVLDNNELKEIAVDFFSPHARVTHLNLNHNQLASLPALNDFCSKISDLRICGNKLKELSPNFIRKMSGLTFLDIRSNPYEDLPLAIFNLDTQNGCQVYGQGLGLDKAYLNTRLFYDLLKAFNKVSLAFKHRQVAYHLLTSATNKTFSAFSLLECLSVPNHELGDRALQQFFKQKESLLKKHPLGPKSEIAVFGKTETPNRLLRRKIKEKGLKYVTKIKASTTHVVVAPKVNDYQSYDQEGLTFIPEETLLEFLEIEAEQYLKDEKTTTEEDVENLATLLHHSDQVNRILALNLMKEGGVPKPLLTDLFLIWRDMKQAADFRKKAIKLLKRNASKLLKKRLREARPIMRESLDEYVLDENLEHYTVETELDAWRIGRYVFKNYKNGLRFWLRHLSKEEQDTLLHFLIEKRPDFTLHNSYFQKLEDLFFYTKAKRVVIENAELSEFPAALLDFKNMWYLSLGYNNLVSLPEELVKLRRLHTLNMKYNNLETFPAIFEQMPKLKMIVVAANRFTYNNKASVNLKIYSHDYDFITVKRK